MHAAAIFRKYKIHHLVFWILLFGVWYFLRYEDYSTTTRAFQVTLIKVIDLAVTAARESRHHGVAVPVREVDEEAPRLSGVRREGKAE